MNNKLSLWAVTLVSIILIFYRFHYSEYGGKAPLKVTTCDAFGYYMYLPSAIIYNDATELKWVPEVEEQYKVTCGDLYQTRIHTNGNHVFKYLGGVAIMELPFFLGAHAVANLTDYPPDGFSPPYQYAIAFAALFYVILSLFLLRKILLKYFDDKVVMATILLLTLASNFIQYVSVESAQSHPFIFALYVLILYLTIKWHEQPGIKWAAFIGLTIGLATISRPTEAIMIFIPILWNMHSRELSKEKWDKVKKYRTHVLIAVAGGLIGILPQLIYWKIASGSFIYDVGSKWFFLNPWFRVLFGFENGWFIYTPITVFFIIGFFFMKNYPFRKSVLVFCLLNIWIVIAWSDWKYGATYSTRALVQSYPLFALAFASFIKHIDTKKIRFVFYPLGMFLIYVNFFQTYQYNENILHYRDMNRKYYASIYLDPDPTPEDMSLLDTDEFIDEADFKSNLIYHSDSTVNIVNQPWTASQVLELEIDSERFQWIKVETDIKASPGYDLSYLHCKTVSDQKVKEIKFRIKNPIIEVGKSNRYSFYFKVPKSKKPTILSIMISSMSSFKTEIGSITISSFSS